jgi:hypothetical protein
LHFTTGNSGILQVQNKVLINHAVSVLKTTPGLSVGNPEQVVNKSGLFNVFILIYSTVSILLLIRFIRNFFRLTWNNSKYEIEYYQGNKLFLINNKSNPYSFLNSIYVNKDDYKNGLIDKELLHHEIAHKVQLHSIDIILTELFKVFYWFNPFIYLFKRAIRANHEYIADYYVLQAGTSNQDYSHKLINYTFRNKCLNLASGFDYFLTKKRLIMISKNKIKRKWLLVSIILTCSITVVLSSMAFTYKQDTKLKEVTFINKTSHNEMRLNDSIIIASEFQATVNNVFLKLPIVQFDCYNATFNSGLFKGVINNDLLLLTLTEGDFKGLSYSSDKIISKDRNITLKGNARISFGSFEFKAKEIHLGR